MSSSVITSLQPVVVINTSPISAAFIIGATQYPSNFAFKADIGSTSVIVTLAPTPEAFFAIPLPTCPYPATTTFFPEINIFVARIIPSIAD
jgi:hypothetical protein